jgi:D-alanyl-D-alanine carboxypeptidase
MRLRRPITRSKNTNLFFLAVILAVGAGLFLYHTQHEKAETGQKIFLKKTTTAPPGFNKTEFSINDPASLWVIVNKGRDLPSTYIPADLVTPSVPLRLSSGAPEMHVRAAAAQAMKAMFDAAAQQSIHLMLASGYRSYAEQSSIYAGYVKSVGQVQADAQSAQPGHSEHQSGWAADLEPASRNCELDQCFGDTPEGKWLSANAQHFGFIVRYQKGKEALTGYEYEPWHVRYVGTDLAAQVTSLNQTLEQFFGLPAVTQYPTSSFQLQPGS